MEIKLRNLLIFTSILIVILVILIVIGIHIFIVSYFHQVFEQDSIKILHSESKNQLSYRLQGSKQRLNTLFGQIFQKQSIFQQLYSWTEENLNNVKIQEPTYCLDQLSELSQNQFFCLKVKGYSSENMTQMRDHFFQDFLFASLFTEFLLPFDKTRMMVGGIGYSTMDDLGLFGTWPSINLSMNYDPHNRTWFKSHIAHMGNGDRNIFSDFFTTLKSSYTISISKNLTNSNSEMMGVVFNIFEFDKFKKYFQGNYMLITLTGQIILGQQEYPQNQREPLYFYNKSITGFDELDFFEITNIISSGNSKSNCKYTIDSQYLCRYNTFYQQDILMIVHQQTDPQIIMVQFIDMTSLYDSVIEKYENIESYFLEQQLYSLFIILILLVLLIIFYTQSITIILKPFYKLINHTIKYTTGNSYNTNMQQWLYIYLFERERERNVNFDSLNRAYLGMLKKLKQVNKKCQNCYDIENSQYPYRWKKIKVKIDGIMDGYLCLRLILFKNFLFSR